MACTEDCAALVAREERVCDACTAVKQTFAELQARVAATDEDCEFLRRCRNAGRETMSGYRGEISPEQQQRWWQYERSRHGVFIFRRAGADCGYALVQRQSRLGTVQPWITVAVSPGWRGMGIGKAIHAWLAERYWPVPLYAETRISNVASIRAKETLGWDRIAADGRAEDGERLVYHRGPAGGEHV